MAVPPAYGAASSAIPFSTTEQVVPGMTWIDGKPIYQKTIDTGALLDTGSNSVAHNVANIDMVLFHQGSGFIPSTGVTSPLPNVSISALTTMIRTSVDRTNVIVQTGSDRSTYLESNVTIWYTKTTD